MSMPAALCFPSLVLTLLAVPAPAPTATPAPAPTRAPAPVRQHVFEPGTHELGIVIDRVAVALGRNYLYVDNEVAGPQMAVRLQSPMTVEHDDLEPMLQSLLYARSLQLVPLAPKHGVAEIIAMNGPRRGEIEMRAAWVEPELVLAERDRADVVVTALSMSHSSTVQVAQQLRPFVSVPGPVSLTIGAMDDHTLVLRGPRCAVAAAIEMARHADEQRERSDAREALDSLRQRVKALESAAGPSGGR